MRFLPVCLLITHDNHMLDLAEHRERLLQFVVGSLHGKVSRADIHVIAVSPDIETTIDSAVVLFWRCFSL